MCLVICRCTTRSWRVSTATLKTGSTLSTYTEGRLGMMMNMLWMTTGLLADSRWENTEIKQVRPNLRWLTENKSQCKITSFLNCCFSLCPRDPCVCTSYRCLRRSRERQDLILTWACSRAFHTTIQLMSLSVSMWLG